MLQDQKKKRHQREYKTLATVSINMNQIVIICVTIYHKIIYSHSIFLKLQQPLEGGLLLKPPREKKSEKKEVKKEKKDEKKEEKKELTRKDSKRGSQELLSQQVNLQVVPKSTAFARVTVSLALYPHEIDNIQHAQVIDCLFN